MNKRFHTAKTRSRNSGVMLSALLSSATATTTTAGAAAAIAFSWRPCSGWREAMRELRSIPSGWRDLPAHFGPWNSVFRRFRRWAKRGVFESLFKTLSGDPDFEYAMIDGTIVRVHQHGAGTRNQAIGRSRGGLTTKIVALVDALGNLARFVLFPAQRHDSLGVEPLIAGIEIEALIADKAFEPTPSAKSWKKGALKPSSRPRRTVAVTSLVTSISIAGDTQSRTSSVTSRNFEESQHVTTRRIAATAL